jgi:hypothetical protein
MWETTGEFFRDLIITIVVGLNLAFIPAEDKRCEKTPEPKAQAATSAPTPKADEDKLVSWCGASACFIAPESWIKK